MSKMVNHIEVYSHFKNSFMKVDEQRLRGNSYKCVTNKDVDWRYVNILSNTAIGKQIIKQKLRSLEKNMMGNEHRKFCLLGNTSKYIYIKKTLQMFHQQISVKV